MLVKLDLINISILSGALSWKGTVYKGLRILEQPTEGHCGWSTEKSSNKNLRKCCIMQGFLSQDAEGFFVCWLVFREI